MSARGQKRTFRRFDPMSALPPKAEIVQHGHDVRPGADTCAFLGSGNNSRNITYRWAGLASDSNLTIRFAQGFPAGLACASLRNARANEHSIECDRPQHLRRWWLTQQARKSTVWRARLVLMTADGYELPKSYAPPARQDGDLALAGTVRDEGAAGLWRDKTRPRAFHQQALRCPNGLSPGMAGPPPGNQRHWTGAAMAKAAGISVSSKLQRIWRAHGCDRIWYAASWLSAIRSSRPSSRRDRWPVRQSARPRHRALGR